MSQIKAVVAKLWIGFSLSLFSLSSHAALPAAQNSAPPPALLSFGGMLQVLFGLGMVLAAIAGTAWLLRRFSPGQIGGGGVLRVIGGVAVGPKERLVLVEIGDTWLVLGVAPGQVNTLHTLPKPEGGAFQAGTTGGGEHGFPAWLKQAIQGRKVERM